MAFHFICFGLLIVLSAYYAVIPETPDEGIIQFMLIILAVLFFAFWRQKENKIFLKGRFLKHSSLFMVGFVIVHFQSYIDLLLGFTSFSNLWLWVNPAMAIKAMVLSIMGLTSFIIGYLFYKRPFKLNQDPLFSRIYSIRPLAISSAILLMLYFATVNPLYLLGRYGVEDVGIAASYFILSFHATTFAFLVQHGRNLISQSHIPKTFFRYMISLGIIFPSVIAIYLISVMISGDRGPIITYCVAIYAGYVFVTKRQVNPFWGGVMLVIGALFISVLGNMRVYEKSEGFISKISLAINAENRFREDSFMKPTQNLANSIRSYNTAIDYVPEKHDFMMGRFQLQQMLSIIPFVSNYTGFLFDDVSGKYMGSSSFITWVQQGDSPYSGEGTTCIADFYLDFGVLGVILGMMIFGYFMRYAEVAMYSNVLPSLFSHTFMIIFISQAIYISRSPVLTHLKATCWAFAILWLYTQLMNKRK